jgi:hypothetical protein
MTFVPVSFLAGSPFTARYLTAVGYSNSGIRFELLKRWFNRIHCSLLMTALQQ